MVIKNPLKHKIMLVLESFVPSCFFRLKSNIDKSRGPWTKPEGWETIHNRMSEFSVREAHGKPTRIRPSVKPSIEIVYMYVGDLNSDGVDEEGYVNFKDKRVVSFKSPHAKEDYFIIITIISTFPTF